MAFRTSSPQGDFFDGLIAGQPSNKTLETIDALIDWEPLRDIMAATYNKSGVGFPGFDPVTLFKLLLLESIYNLSDVRVCEEAADRISFRKFAQIPPSAPVPDDTTLVRFRKRLREAKLYDKLFAEVNRQLSEHGVGVRKGSMKIIDATLIQSACTPPPKNSEKPPRDPDADYTVKNNKPVHGYKLHVARDEPSKLIAEFEVTKASVHDSQVFEQLLDDDDTAAAADKAYDNQERRVALKENGIEPLIMIRKPKGCEEYPLVKKFNQHVGRLRAPVENTIGNLKRWRRCARAVYLGLDRVIGQVIMGVIAHNLITVKSRLEKCAP